LERKREREGGDRRDRRGWSHRSVITTSGSPGEERWPFHKLKAQCTQITWRHVQESWLSRELSDNEQQMTSKYSACSTCMFQIKWQFNAKIKSTSHTLFTLMMLLLLSY